MKNPFEIFKKQKNNKIDDLDKTTTKTEISSQDSTSIKDPIINEPGLEIDKALAEKIKHNEYILKAKEGNFGIDEERHFFPEEPLTREMAARVLTNVMPEIFPVVEIKDFIDVDEISPWALDSAKKMVASGIMETFDGKFNPKAVVEEEEAALYIEKIKTILNQQKLSEEDKPKTR